MKKYIKSGIVDPSEESLATRISLAKSETTRSVTLERLAKDYDPRVRYAVLLNPAAPEEIKNLVAKDSLDVYTSDFGIDMQISDIEKVKEFEANVNALVDAAVEAGGGFCDEVMYWRNGWYDSTDSEQPTLEVYYTGVCRDTVVSTVTDLVESYGYIVVCVT